MIARVLVLSALPALAAAQTPAEQAKALLAAKDCDQLLLSFENAKPKGDAADLGLAQVLAQAASGPCASDKVVAVALATTASRLAPANPEVLLAAAGASRAAGMNGEAEETYRKAIAASPKDPRPRLAVAELLLAERDAAGAMKALEPIRTSDPKAKALYAKAQKAARDSSAETEQLRKGEERAMDAAAKAMATDAERPEGAAPKEQETTSSASTVSLAVGAEKVLDVPGVARLAIQDPGIADVRPKGATQVAIVGKAAGRTMLLVWLSNGSRRSYLVQVRR